jgi:hypothetical protein
MVGLLGILSFARGAYGDPTQAEIAVARRHFEAAVSFEGEGQWQQAIRELEVAISIKETPGLRFHLGLCKERLGRLADAQLEYERTSGIIKAGITAEDVERLLAPKLEDIRRRVPTLTVQLPPDVKEADLQIDGVPVNRALVGTAIPLNPGTHALVVYAAGRRAYHVQVTLGEGASVTQAAELVPDVLALMPSPPSRPVPQPAERPVAPPSGSGRGWVLAGEGAMTIAGLASGLVFMLNASADKTHKEDLQSRIDATGQGQVCKAPSTALVDTCSDLESTISAQHRDTALEIAGFSTAGVGLGALIATWILWKPDEPRAQVLVVPYWGARAWGTAARWSFK